MAAFTLRLKRTRQWAALQSATSLQDACQAEVVPISLRYIRYRVADHDGYDLQIPCGL